MQKRYIKKLAYLISAGVIAFISQNLPFEKQNTSSKTQINKNYILTKHAKCRMKCRHIDNQDITEILTSGKKIIVNLILQKGRVLLFPWRVMQKKIHNILEL